MHEHSDWLKSPTFNSPPTKKKSTEKKSESTPPKKFAII